VSKKENKGKLLWKRTKH